MFLGDGNWGAVSQEHCETHSNFDIFDRIGDENNVWITDIDTIKGTIQESAISPEGKVIYNVTRNTAYYKGEDT